MSLSLSWQISRFVNVPLSLRIIGIPYYRNLLRAHYNICLNTHNSVKTMYVGLDSIGNGSSEHISLCVCVCVCYVVMLWCVNVRTKGLRSVTVVGKNGHNFGC